MTEAIETGTEVEATVRAVDDPGWYRDDLTFSDLASLLGRTLHAGSVREALQQAAFLACVDVIAQDISKAPLQLRERLPNNTSRLVMPERHPMAELLALDPNPEHTWPEFQEMMALWYAVSQNAYAWIQRKNTGEIIALHPLRAEAVMERVNAESGEVFYDYSSGSLEEEVRLGTAHTTIPARDVIHVRGRMFDGLVGYSTMLVGRSTLDTGKAIEDYRSKLFHEEGAMRGVFRRTMDGLMPEEAFQRLRSQLGMLMRRFRDISDPIVLEGGLEFEPIASNPQDAELTKQFEAQIVATCRLLRVPPHKVMHLVNVKYENMETLEKAYVGDTLEPILRRFEHRYANRLLSRKDRLRLFFYHDREALVLKDTKAETERTIRLIERGVIEINEGRSRMGYEPIPGGETRLIPLNSALVDENNNVLIPVAPAPAEKPKEEPEEDEDEEAEAKDEKRLRLAVDNG